MVCLVAFAAISQAQQPAGPYDALTKKLRSMVGKWETVEKSAIREIKGSWEVRPVLDECITLEYSSTDNKSLLVFGLWGEKDAKGTIVPHVVVHVTNGGAVFTDFFGDYVGDVLTVTTRDKRQQMVLSTNGDEATWVRSFLENGKSGPFISVTAKRAKG
ncbi:MAG: hypothetical protein JSS65_10690 [Armatimonadetes bacterium]|nr:hypothetical protein [Armatimonadota bacterium]